MKYLFLFLLWPLMAKAGSQPPSAYMPFMISYPVASFSPTNEPGYAAYAWYDPNYGITNATGQTTNAPDMTGNGFTLFQTTASKAPYNTNAVNGNLPWRFDGSDDTLRNANFALLGTNYEVWIAYKYWNQADSAYHGIWAGTNSSPKYPRGMVLDDNRLGIGDSSDGIFAGHNTNIWIVLTYTRNQSGNVRTLWTNGVQASTAALGGSGLDGNADFQGLAIAANFNDVQWYLPAYIGDNIYYQTNLGDPTSFWTTQRSNLYNWMTNRWH